MIDRDAALDALADGYGMDSDMKRAAQNGLNKMTDLEVINHLHCMVKWQNRTRELRTSAEERRASRLESSFTD